LSRVLLPVAFCISHGHPALRIPVMLGVGGNTCQASCLGGQDHGSRSAWERNCKNPSQTIAGCVLACTFHLGYGRKPKTGESWSRPAWAKGETLSSK
jgi:hypothetical protein